MHDERRTIHVGRTWLAWLVIGCAAALAGDTCWAAADHTTVLEIEDLPSGGKRAVATLHLPVPPKIVAAVLTDYERWPGLFDDRFRIAKLERREHGAVTELLIKRSPLPGELRLLCETHELSDGEIVTSLLEGDFKQYQRRWRLSPEVDGEQMYTKADMELVVEMESWVPGWLFTMTLRSDLETHFDILRERAIARFAGR